ncbi:MAG: hypothetical protein IKB93_01310 [Clostridia bacterium]|nr:hypothetical protein [Clostridia bacterium]
MKIVRYLRKIISNHVQLMPGNEGKDCPGNGEHKWIECQCDECDYLMCCLPEYNPGNCKDCDITDCPRIKAKKRGKFSY